MANKITLQKQLSNGNWCDIKEKSIEKYLSRILRIGNIMAKNLGKPEVTEEDVLKQLKTGKSLNYGSDWDAKIRMKPTKEQEEVKNQKLAKAYEASEKYQREEAKRMHENVNKYERW